MPSEEVVQKRLVALDTVAREVFGYANGMKPLQKEITEANIRGQDVLFVVPTSSGKSFCFQGPALVRPGITIVVSPLIALMRNQVAKLRAWGINAEFLSADMSADDQRNILLRLPALDLLYVAPERVKTTTFLDALAPCKVSGIAIDECHCLAQWAMSFRSAYAKIGVLRERYPNVPILAVTATADEDTEKHIVRITGIKNYKRVVLPPDRENLTYYGIHEASMKHMADKIREMTRGGGSAIVYVTTRPGTEDTAQQLRDAFGIEKISHYHAGVDPLLRSSIQDRFLSGEITTLVATNSFGMGVDHGTVRLVYHWWEPASMSDYAQESGRAGRDGLPSECWLNICKKGTQKQDFFTRNSNPEPWVYDRLWRILTRSGRLGSGEVVKVSIPYLQNQLGMKDHNKSQVDSAMAFMEFLQGIEVNAGPLTYRLPVRNSAIVRSYMGRFSGIKLQQNVCEVTIDPTEIDPVNDMVRAGAVSFAPPQEQKLIKLLSSKCIVTEQAINEKRRKADEQHMAVRRMIDAPDKAAYLRSYFLKG